MNTTPGPYKAQLLEVTMHHSSIYPLHLVHLATINNVITPEGYHHDLAVCKCGVVLQSFWAEPYLPETYSDGTPYRKNCPRCFKAG